jgi:hypothetical protein
MSISQSTSAPSAEPPAEPAPPASSGPFISEDWLATIIGLGLLVLVLAGVITKGMVP